MPPFQIVRSATHLEVELLRHPAPELEFESSELEQAYERLDFSLATQIEAAVFAPFPDTPKDELLLDNYDWWPNKSRSVVVSERAFSAQLVERLASLLRGQFSDWRIHLNVCKALEPNPDETELGSLCIMPTQVIIESKLHALLKPEA
jgi:hypothetical protein